MALKTAPGHFITSKTCDSAPFCADFCKQARFIFTSPKRVREIRAAPTPHHQKLTIKKKSEGISCSCDIETPKAESKDASTYKQCHQVKGHVRKSKELASLSVVEYQLHSLTAPSANREKRKAPVFMSDRASAVKLEKIVRALHSCK